MNGEQLDNALRAAYDELGETAGDFQGTCDLLIKLADGEFTDADDRQFTRLYNSMAVGWAYMRALTAKIERLEAAVTDNGGGK